MVLNSLLWIDTLCILMKAMFPTMVHMCSYVFWCICLGVLLYIDFSFMSGSWARAWGSILREDVSTVPVQHFPPQRKVCVTEWAYFFFFLGQRETFHTTEKCDFNFKGILTGTNIDDEPDSNLLLDSHINFLKTLMLFCEKGTGWCWTECITLNEEVEDYHSHAVGLQQTK